MDNKFDKVNQWLDDDRNRVSANSVQTGVEWVGLFIAIFILYLAIFN